MNRSLDLTVDVVVCGGGIAGTMAAVAAARAGAKTALVERYGFLGGNATAGAVGQFNSWQTSTGRRVIGGLADEVVSRLEKAGGSGGHSTWTMSTGHLMDRVEYSPEILKLVLDDMVMSSGVVPLLHSVVFDVGARNGRIDTIEVLAKNERISVNADVVIDTSGDLEVLRRAGASFLQLEVNEDLQPATMMFRFGPVDFATYDAVSPETLQRLAHEGVDAGLLARASLHVSKVPHTSEGWFNISRLAVDATDPLALGKAEIEGRRQAAQAAEYLRRTVPGCERGVLTGFATQVGVRETRRMLGDYVLSADDLRQGVRFPDAIAAGAYPIDIHPATGSDLKYEELGEDHSYQIPYRALIPASLENVLVAGRGISATHEANAAIRVMPIAMAVGQAAGTAAAMAAQLTGRVRDADIEMLRASLKGVGAIVE